MPPYPKPVSQAQRGAVYAAAQGDSTIGIPKKVGSEFVKGDKPGALPEKAPPPRKKIRRPTRSQTPSTPRRSSPWQS
jgi:hypothetical protein